MNEKRCACCRFWGEKRINVCYRTCLVSSSCVTGHPTHQDFGCVHWQQREPDLREQLAEYAHEAWSGWMQYMFDKTTPTAHGHYVIGKRDAIRWFDQKHIDYQDLAEVEKASDLAEADKMIAIFEKWQQKGE